MKQRLLILGSDSTVTRYLKPLLSELLDVTIAGRSKGIDSYFDIKNPELLHDILQSSKFDYCLINTSISSFAACLENPDFAEQINHLNTLYVAQTLSQYGVVPIFLSSSAVFSGRSQAPLWNSPKDPLTFYGQLKSNAEDDIYQIPNSIIVRLTKFLPSVYPIFDKVLKSSGSIEPLPLFKDHYFSPVSPALLAKAIASLILGSNSITNRRIFHVSGDRALSYYEFGRILAERRGIYPEKIIPTNAPDSIQKIRNACLGLVLGDFSDSIDNSIQTILADFQ